MSDGKQPENALIIGAGEGRQDAIDLGQGIWMSKDISNLYRVVTPDGDVQINTGMIFNAAENLRRFAAVSSNSVVKIVFTQSHEDHIGGWTDFNAPGVETIGQANFAHVRGYFKDAGGLGPTMSRRSTTATPVRRPTAIPRCFRAMRWCCSACPICAASKANATPASARRSLGQSLPPTASPEPPPAARTR